jgi:hypothetical protein
MIFSEVGSYPLSLERKKRLETDEFTVSKDWTSFTVRRCVQKGPFNDRWDLTPLLLVSIDLHHQWVPNLHNYNMMSRWSISNLSWSSFTMSLQWSLNPKCGCTVQCTASFTLDVKPKSGVGGRVMFLPHGDEAFAQGRFEWWVVIYWGWRLFNVQGSSHLALNFLAVCQSSINCSGNGLEKP